MKNEQNVGKTDRIIRVIVGVIFLYLGYAFSSWFYVLGAIAFITAITGFCGLYKLLKISTCKARNKLI